MATALPRLASALWLLLVQVAAQPKVSCDHLYRYDHCVQTTSRCGLFPQNTSNLTVVGFTMNGDCIVAEIRPGGLSGRCRGEQLRGEEICGSAATIYNPSAFQIVVFSFLVLQLVVLLFLLGHLCTSSLSKSRMNAYYWFSNLWASFFFNLLATAALTMEMEEQMKSFCLALLVAMAMQEISFHMPLQLMHWWCTRCPISLCALMAWTLGSIYGWCGITASFEASMLATVSPDVLDIFLNGVIQFMVDALKESIKHQITECLYPSNRGVLRYSVLPDPETANMDSHAGG